MTDFLYPFIESDESDVGPLLADLERSVAAKTAESRALCASVLASSAARVEAIAQALSSCFAAGGQMLTFGNGGSSADADACAAALSGPGRATRSLVADAAVVTAVANDIGFDLVFSRQIIAFGRPGDIAAGFSTSGNSTNVVKAFEQARRLGLTTVAFAGYDGGAMARSPAVDYCLVVPSQSVHRIQEAQAALTLALARRVSPADG